MVNYTGESKIKAIHRDNYVEDMHKDAPKRNVSCWMCVFCGENKELPLFQKKYLCAKYVREVAVVQGPGTCDSAKTRFKWYNRLYAKLAFMKNISLEKTGFKFLGR